MVASVFGESCSFGVHFLVDCGFLVTRKSFKIEHVDYCFVLKQLFFPLSHHRQAFTRIFKTYLARFQNFPRYYLYLDSQLPRLL